jgi:hypothetical protein
LVQLSKRADDFDADRVAIQFSVANQAVDCRRPGAARFRRPYVFSGRFLERRFMRVKKQLTYWQGVRDDFRNYLIGAA